MNLLARRAVPAAPSPTLLVVQDHFPNLQWLRKTLESNGCNLVLANSRGEALNLGRQIGFDAVVIDLTYTEKSGLELARALRANTPCVSPIVLLTSAPADEQLTDGACLEDVELLPRPVDGARLAELIRRLTAGSAGESPPQAQSSG